MTPCHSPPSSQQGVSLFAVMVMLLLSLLLVLGSTRVGLLNEKMAGNSADYQRAYEAAEALLKDATIDISCLNASTESPCTGRTGLTNLTCDGPQGQELLTVLSANTPPCQNGICSDLGELVNGDPDTSFWSPKNTSDWNALTADNVGARFGQYTTGEPAANTAINPILRGQARYWIELLPYGGSEGGRSVASENSVVVDTANCPYVFRITAAAKGLKPGTTAVLQSFYFFRRNAT